MANSVETTLISVRRLIRRRGSSEFYKFGGWTRNAHEAENFSDILQAAKTCANEGLENVELVLRVSPGACDIFCTGMR